MNIFLRVALNISVKLKGTEVSDMFFYFTSRIVSDVLSLSYHSAKLVPVSQITEKGLDNDTEQRAMHLHLLRFCFVIS